ncbi:MAG: (2Fe-2S)-binding protein [Bdellovibrionaceae bacterium]|nr:(2Fe-2S)-binding protein [Pseudobdellovibrionaceae bacterium]
MTIYFASNKSHLQPIDVPKTSPEGHDQEKSLMELLLDAKIPVASSCKGDGICGKCRIQILSNPENLSVESALETKTKMRNKVSASERLCCQTYVRGDIKIDTSYW